MSKQLQAIYAKVRNEVVLLGGTVLAILGAVAAFTSGTVHTVAQDALPLVALAVAWFTRNQVFSLAAVNDLIASVKAAAAAKAARPAAIPVAPKPPTPPAK